jgi:uncharacterized protein YecE (DUF72 family)
MTLFVGTSGWHYDQWHGLFYPDRLARKDWLAYYGHEFQTVELNNAFYRLPTAEAFEAWAAVVPEDFVVAVKASRYLTHIKRLKDPVEPVGRLIAAARGLGAKLGPVLLQLPPTLTCDVAVLRAALGCFPVGTRVAVETRHDSWHDDSVRSALADHGAAWVLVDPPVGGRPMWHTADWGYVRFHRGTGRPESCYNRSPLETWARRLAALWSASDDVFCYFNNDGHGCAPRDARRFASAAGRAGLRPTRVPGPRRTPVSGPSG